jgi:hypothetical protein
MGRLSAVEFPVGVFATPRLPVAEEQVGSMSPHDSFTFPEFLPLGLVVRPYGGIKAEPPDVKAEEDLPRRFMFGCLQKGSFRTTESGWASSYRHPIPETGAVVAYNNGMLEVNFSWRGQKWMAIALRQTFTDVHLWIYPASLDKAMKERLEQRYNLAYCLLNEKIGRDCYFPDGPPRCIVCPIRVSSLGTARKALQSMEQDEAIVAPLFASAVMGLSVIDKPSSGTFLCRPRSAPILPPVSTVELPPAGVAESYRSEDGTEVLRIRRRQYFAAFQTFFCDLERVAQWLHAFPLVGNAPDGLRDEERLDSIERRGFVCQGSELAGVTIEYRENKMRQVAFSIRFDPSKLVSLTDSGAMLDEMIQAVRH